MGSMRPDELKNPPLSTHRIAEQLKSGGI